jgi:hypothetical protein
MDNVRCCIAFEHGPEVSNLHGATHVSSKIVMAILSLSHYQSQKKEALL